MSSKMSHILILSPYISVRRLVVLILKELMLHQNCAECGVRTEATAVSGSPRLDAGCCSGRRGRDCWREVPPPRVSHRSISGTGSLCRLPPRVQRQDRDAHPTPAFLSKSAEAIENKGRRTEKERQERKRVRKDKELKEIEEEDAKGSAGFVRHNTANHTTVP